MEQLEDDEEKSVALYEDIYNRDNSENVNGEKNEPPKSSKNTITENTKENTKNTITENTKENKTETNQKETKEEKTQNNQPKNYTIFNIIKDIRKNINENIKEKADDFNQNKYKTTSANSNNNSIPETIKNLEKRPEPLKKIGNKDEEIPNEIDFEFNRDNN